MAKARLNIRFSHFPILIESRDTLFVPCAMLAGHSPFPLLRSWLLPVGYV
jgi:hypothetical protein